MRKRFKIFGLMLLIVFLISLTYNVNKIYGYFLFDQSINDRLYGLSVAIPITFLAFMMCKDALFFIEKVICKLFVWIALSGLVDELLFDPYTANWHEHATAIFILLLLTIYEKSRGKLSS